MPEATGRFDVTLTPEGPPAESDGTTITRLALAKQYTGGLTGSGIGLMVATRTRVEGSAGYVATELVTGSLDGLDGSFVLQHHGLMDREKPSLTITVVPDSGTGALGGIAGHMSIDITDEAHFYRIEYTLA